MSLLQTKRSAYNRTLFFIIPHFWGMFNKTFFKKQMDHVRSALRPAEALRLAQRRRSAESAAGRPDAA